MIFIEQNSWEIEKVSLFRINSSHPYTFSKDNVYLWGTRQAYLLPIIEYSSPIKLEFVFRNTTQGMFRYSSTLFTSLNV